jgi:phage-related protein
MQPGLLRELVWIASSLEDLRGFPGEVRQAMGFALYEAQRGGKHPSAKPLKGFRGAGVVEVIEDHDGNAYRTVYTVSLGAVVYVLHAFQKKSKTGIATPKPELDLIRQRLVRARQINESRGAREKGSGK